MNGKSILWLAICALLSGSCSKVVFEADPNAGNPGGGTPPPGTSTLPNIVCSTYFNNHLSSVNINSAAQNPSVHADCTPANVNLTWTVRKSGGSPITISGLQGANSASADFFVAGSDTYEVTLQATAPNYNTLNTSPITAIVQTGAPPPLTAITCQVTANGGTAPVTVPSGVPSIVTNPHIVATCTPAAGSYVWTVLRGGSSVTIPGLTGFDSRPDFPGMPAGVYEVFLRVTQTGYLPYDTTTPLQITVTAPTTHAVTTTKTVTASNNQLDILLVVDDSNSMLADNQRLASRLNGFVTNLTNYGFDWQMCATVTRPQQVTLSNPNLYWGASNFWSGNTTTPSYILKSGTPNLNTIFTDTITAIGAGNAGSNDERGIKAAWWHLYNGDVNYTPNSGCHRRDAGLAMIFISDEDERSVGGDPTQAFYTGEYMALENDDLPANLIAKVKAVFGNSKRFVANSIIVRPGDTACLAAQDAEGSKAHYGTKYAELSQLTGGYTESICNTDFSQSLEYFKNSIVTQMQSITLDCTPIGTPVVTITPAMTYTFSTNADSMLFTPAIPAGRTIQIQYTCPN